VKYFKADVNAIPSLTKDTTIMRSLDKPRVNSFEDISKIRNREDKNITFFTDADTSLRDFYWRYDRNIEKYDSTKYAVTMSPQTDTLDEGLKAKYEGKNVYELTMSNKGGLVMPIIIEWTYKDGTKEVDRIPAQVWRLNEKKVTKVFVKDKEVASIKLDPMRETADIDESNNSWGSVPEPTKFQLFKAKQAAARGQTPGGINPMQKSQNRKAF
jgi:hypothetical protein